MEEMEKAWQAVRAYWKKRMLWCIERIGGACLIAGIIAAFILGTTVGTLVAMTVSESLALLVRIVMLLVGAIVGGIVGEIVMIPINIYKELMAINAKIKA